MENKSLGRKKPFLPTVQLVVLQLYKQRRWDLPDPRSGNLYHKNRG